ncbi:DUF1178 family protein [Alphaproteobacteria bacterium]|nr:DUF1178 family protein [Alphaproteobacteria bacterium]
MIKYKLKCKSEYCSEQNEFDGWFQNIEAFETQMSSGLINCPICGSYNIIKLLATPNVRKVKTQISKNARIENETVDKNSDKNVLGNENIKNITTMLRTIKKEIQKNSTFVGDKFVSEARSMKEGEKIERPIHGHGTKKEIQELLDEGIDVVSIPWIPDDH